MIVYLKYRPGRVKTMETNKNLEQLSAKAYQNGSPVYAEIKTAMSIFLKQVEISEKLERQMKAEMVTNPILKITKDEIEIIVNSKTYKKVKNTIENLTIFRMALQSW